MWAENNLNSTAIEETIINLYSVKPKRRKLNSESSSRTTETNNFDCKEDEIKLTVNDSEFELLDSTNSYANAETEIYVETNTETEDSKNTEVETDKQGDWSQKDFQKLVQQIEIAVPKEDTLAFDARIKKLNWNDIAFNGYSGEKCKKAWSLIQKEIRSFRLLEELLHDAKGYLANSWPIFLQNKNKHHSDNPKRPSAYQVFYNEKKGEVLLQNPGIESEELSKMIDSMFESLSASEKKTYVKLAAKECKMYNGLYQNLQNVSSSNSFGTSLKITKAQPTRPRTPFELYYEDLLDNHKPVESDISSFKKMCKDKWKGETDIKKLIWINLALEKESQYREELKKYAVQNPNCSPTANKSVLTKDEKLLKDKLAKKPKKPPISAYGLFTQMMMHSEDIKKIDIKNRMKAIAEQWNASNEETKKDFKEYSVYLMEKYQSEYIDYLNNLPYDERKLELENNASKLKKSSNPTNNTGYRSKSASESEIVDGSTVPSNIESNIAFALTSISTAEEYNIVPDETFAKEDYQQPNEESEQKKSKKKHKKEGSGEERTNKNTEKFLSAFRQEPETPPLNGLSLFRNGYSGKVSVRSAWIQLSKKEKKKYESEVSLIKEEYIGDYETFLKGLSQEQLAIFSQMKKKANLRKVSDIIDK